MPGADLLPANASPFESAAALVAARVSALPVPLRELWDADAIPEPLLPWLAWAMSVDVWNPDWPVERRREVVGRSLELHALKGTLAGIRAYVELAGGEIDRAIIPPVKSFLSPSLTREERESFLWVYPQIRIFTRYDDGVSDATFWDDFSGSFDTDEAAAPIWFTWETDLSSRAGTFAVLWDQGVETPLPGADVSGIVGQTQSVLLPGFRPDATFSGEPLGLAPYLPASTAGERLYSFNITKTAPSERLTHLFPIGPGPAPINSEPDSVALTGFAPASVFCDEPLGEYFVPSTAAERLFLVIYLNDGRRAPGDRRAISFLDDDRFGIAPFTAEIAIMVPGERSIWIADDFVCGFFYDAPKDRLRDVLDAVVAAKAARDTVMVDTTIFRPPLIGSPLFIGTPIILGAYIRS